MQTGKRAICAGPGNPPVLVDDTACMKRAAKAIIQGAAYDNNLLCIGEKQVFAVEAIFDKLIATMQRHGAALLNQWQIDALTKKTFTFDNNNEPHLSKDLIGKDARDLASAAGTSVPLNTQLLVGITDFKHPFVQEEQMMPFVPFVRCRDVDEAITRAVESEHGYRHTALIHSRNVDTITRFARAARTTLFVVNGPSMAGLGLGGEGYLSYSIATPTGEGVTTPLTFTRFRRTTMVGSMRFI
jgi:aldehyde dehydrogenase